MKAFLKIWVFVFGVIAMAGMIYYVFPALGVSGWPGRVWSFSIGATTGHLLFLCVKNI